MNRPGSQYAMTILNFDPAVFWSTAGHLSWFEVGMLLCFGASWPFSILKMLRTGHSEGKSYFFLCLVMFGYLFGMIHKLFYHLDVVILLYAILFLVVGTDLIITVKTRRAQFAAEQNSADGEMS